MKQNLSWWDISTVLGAVVFCYVVYQSHYYLSSGNPDVMVIIICGLAVFGLGFGLKKMKMAARHFRLHFIGEMTLLSVILCLGFVIPDSFFHSMTVYSRRGEIREKITASITQSESMFAEYERYVNARETLYASKLNNAVAGREINPADYIRYGFEYGRIAESDQIRNKLFTLHATLISPEYLQLKQTGMAGFARAREKINGEQPLYKAVDAVKEVEHLSVEMLNELIHLSMNREKNETAVNFSLTHDLVSIKSIFQTGYDLTPADRLYSFCWIVTFTLLLLLSCLVSKRHKRAPRPVWKVFKDDTIANGIDLEAITNGKSNSGVTENTSGEVPETENTSDETEKYQNRDYYIDNVSNLEDDVLAEVILAGIVTLDELGKKGTLDLTKRKNIKQIIEKMNKEREAVQNLKEMRKTINAHTFDDYINTYGIEHTKHICEVLGIDYENIKSLETPNIRYGITPSCIEDIPFGYMDIFLWGSPSSGKTCALAVILYTIKKIYSLIHDTDLKAEYGKFYKDSLINIFNKDGYVRLPGPTVQRIIQYIPFLLRRDEAENKGRRIGLYDMAGEIYQRYYEFEDEMALSDEIRQTIEKTMMFLENDHLKMHFFFIDPTTKTNTVDHNNLSQVNYLEAIMDYLRKKKILKNKTHSVHIVITKCDKIESETAIKTLFEGEYHNFYKTLETICTHHNIPLSIQLFSIGDVVFQQYCKVNTAYSEKIIELIMQSATADTIIK